MARPVTISEDKILEAARALFTAKGPRATTAQIAARAGVSEGTLFKRYGSKAALHKAAMTSGGAGDWIQRQMRAQAPLRTQADLARFIRWQTKTLRDVVPVVIMAWSSSRSHAAERPTDLTGRKPAPLVAIHTFAELLEREMDAGHLVRRNAEAVARIVTGSVWYFVFLGVLLDKPGGGMHEDAFVDELARMVFADLEPARARTQRRRRRTRR
jgi:AcrR family transcriptional regulator